MRARSLRTPQAQSKQKWRGRLLLLPTLEMLAATKSLLVARKQLSVWKSSMAVSRRTLAL
jgi:hypothetical protein